MIKRVYRLVLFVLLLIVFVSFKSDNPSDQLKDFEVFKKVLLEKERVDLHKSASSIQNYLYHHENNLKIEHTKLIQFKLLASTLSKIECGHTQIHPNKYILKEWLSSRKALPIDYYLIGQRLVVSKTLSADLILINENKPKKEFTKSIPSGAEIISIDNLTVPEMMNEMGNFLSSDENSIEFKYYQASQMFEFYRHLALPFNRDSIRVEYVYKKDTAEIYFMPGAAPVHTMNNRLRKGMLNYEHATSSMGSFSIVKGCGYFRFKSFKSCFGKKYEEFLAGSFREIHKRKVDKLIIDLRGNTGGAMQYKFMNYIVGEDVYLGRYVVEKPKQTLESKHFKKISADYIKHIRMSKIQKRLKRKGEFKNGNMFTGKTGLNKLFKGEIVVITDEGTFSSASILACHLKTLANAKIIGRKSGGSFYSGNAGTLILVLPKSKFHVFINPNTFYSHLPSSNDPNAIKEPDLYLSPLIINQQNRNEYYFNQAYQFLN